MSECKHKKFSGNTDVWLDCCEECGDNEYDIALERIQQLEFIEGGLVLACKRQESRLVALEKRNTELKAKNAALVGENKHLKLCAELANDRSNFNNRRI